MHFNRLSILVSGTLFIFCSSLFIACNNTAKSNLKTPEKVEFKQAFKEKNTEKNVENLQLLEYACLYCHKLQESDDTTPTIKAIKDVYKSAYPVKEDFVDTFVGFSNQALKEPLLMKTKALDQCVLMQKKSELANVDIKDIADYIFDYMP